MADKEKIKCVICKKDIEIEPNGWDGGHNAWPARDKGRCCGKCNNEIVMPLRLSRYYKNEEKTNDK